MLQIKPFTGKSTGILQDKDFALSKHEKLACLPAHSPLLCPKPYSSATQSPGVASLSFLERMDTYNVSPAWETAVATKKFGSPSQNACALERKLTFTPIRRGSNRIDDYINGSPSSISWQGQSLYTKLLTEGYQSHQCGYSSHCLSTEPALLNSWQVSSCKRPFDMSMSVLSCTLNCVSLSPCQVRKTCEDDMSSIVCKRHGLHHVVAGECGY